jgi:hypothetical protein
MAKLYRKIAMWDISQIAHKYNNPVYYIAFIEKKQDDL